MLELNLLRKNKINLSDYNSKQDIENRILISDFSTADLKVLEEILFSPLKISLKKLARSLQIPEKELLTILHKLAASNLLSIQDDSITVDKEIRKGFEFQIQRFDADFKPDMEFLQGLLRKVPIHLLPIWYAIPRSSNNIFESIVEKYLLTPQIYQRYLNELNFNDCVGPGISQAARGIMTDLFKSPDYLLSSSDVIAKYNLTRSNFEEVMLLLEFHFVCTIHYAKEEEHWHEIITPFYEWHQYLRFVQATKAPIIEPSKISNPKKIDADKKVLYRHSINITSERHIRDAEKSLQRVMHGGWILFDHFIQGAVVPLNVDSIATLKKGGNHWKYTLPVYSEAEKKMIHTAIFTTLFEGGMVEIGTCEGKDCFAVTPFGRLFFEG